MESDDWIQNMEFMEEGLARNVNLGGISTLQVFKALRPEDIFRGDIGRKEVSTRPDSQDSPTFRGPGNKGKPTKETRKEHPKIEQENEK